SAKTPLIDIREGRAVQALHGDAIDHSALSRLYAEEVLSVGIDSKDLVEDLSADQRVVHRELHRRRKLQAVGHIDVENQLGKRGAVFELHGRIRERRVSAATDEHCLAAANAQIAVTGSRREIDDKTRAGTVEITLNERARVDQAAVVEEHVVGILVTGVSGGDGYRIGPG